VKTPDEEVRELLGAYAEGAGKQSVSIIAEKVKALINKRRYGLTTSDNTAKALKSINETDKFKRLKQCVGNHWALEIIRVGLHIADLNEEGQREIVEEVRAEVYHDKGALGMKIIGMGSTHAIDAVIDCLSDLKMRDNLPQDYLAKELDRIISEWERITVFVKKDSDVANIKAEILKHIELRQLTFFVFSYGSVACNNGSRAIARLSNEKHIMQKGYLYFLKPKQDCTGCKIFSWIFKLCSSTPCS
jgi:hypothetical protein